MKNGLFLTIEGCDGSGKTTACKTVISRLQQEGYDVVYTREPGGSEIAEQIRNVILDVKNTAMDKRCEALLYAAGRRQHLTEIILPALTAGKIVICDRFIDSSLAYQGNGRGIGMDEIFKINEFAIENHLPDMTVYYSIDAQEGLRRISGRENLDRLDAESIDFHKKVQQGYEILCQKYPKRIKVIDASLSKEEVAENTYKLIKEKINEYVQ
ncbi:MAG: dTMP kinase [Erysipelotrichia bacterium]|nr:dTMP kinase [Erysipelotrichia bacterium]